MTQKNTILLTGATGYIGGRLLTRLQDKNYHIRCLTRRPEALLHKTSANTELAKGDVQNKESLIKALQGVQIAYYLVHSMESGDDFESQDRTAAQNFAAAAQQCGVKRIIYVGGLGDSTKKLSQHLRSRQEVGQILRKSDAQVLEFRASIVIGAGSLSFEMVRALVDRLPILIMPKWVQVPAQPIWIQDLLSYIEQGSEIKISGHQIFEIGGTEVVSYRGIMEEYAKQRGLKRLMINVPVLTPYLSSLWLGLVTPVFAKTGRKLISSLKNPTIVKNRQNQDRFDVQPVGLSLAIQKALAKEDLELAETRWSDALSSRCSQDKVDVVTRGHRIVMNRAITVTASPEQAFPYLESIGGKKGWYYANWLWRFRGLIDLFCGGVGMRRGRKHSSRLHVGDAVDWWRVERISPNKELLFFAEMKVPGRAWLKFEVEPDADGKKVTITQSAIFDPNGIVGLLYWYITYPIHVVMFSGMLREIAKKISPV